MSAACVEFRRPRLWLWATITTAGWLVVDFLMRHRWEQDWSAVSLWTAVPVLYLGIIVAVGSADTNRLRLNSGISLFDAAAARPRWHARAWSLGVTVLVQGVLPGAVVGAVLFSIVASSGSPDGRFTLAYTIAGILQCLSMIGLGRLVSGLTSSRVAAPILALVFGLALSINLYPMPAENPVWLEPNPIWMIACACKAIALLAAGELASLGRLARRNRSASGYGLTATAVGVATVGLVTISTIGPGAEVQVPRSSATPGVCRTTAQGSSVCVWPEDERYLDELTAQVKRLEEISAGLPFEPNKWSIREPSLNVGSEDSVIIVEPPSAGAGMWLTAQSMAFGLTFECALPEFSAKESLDNEVHSWATLDATSNYIYGHPRPAEVVVAADAVAVRTDAIVADVFKMSGEEQRGWIVNAWNEWNGVCV